MVKDEGVGSVNYKTLPVAYQSLDRQGIIRFVNDEWLKLFGYKRSEVTGKWFGEFHSESSRARYKLKFPSLFKTKEVRTSEYELVTKSGSLLIISINVKVDYSDPEQPITHCILNDITSIKKTEEKLISQNVRFISLYEKYSTQLDEQKALNTEMKSINAKLCENELRLQLAIDSSKMGYWDYNLDKGEIWLSPEYYRIRGYKPDEYKSKPDAWINNIHPDYRAMFYQLQKDLFTDPSKPQSFDFLLRIKSGKYIWARIRGKVAELNDQGIPSRIIGTLTDISNRKNAELALRESVVQYRNLFDLAPYPIILFSKNKIQIVNQAAVKVLEAKSEEDLVGCSPFSIVHKDLLPKFKKIITGLMKTGGSTEPIEEKFYTLSGKEIYVELVGSVTTFEGKSSIQLIFNDITERKISEQIIEEREEQYRSLFHLSPFPIVVHQNGKVVLLNDAALKFLRAEESNLVIGKSVLDFAHPDDVPLALERMQKLINDRGFSDLAVERFKNLSGEYRYVEVIASIFKYQGNDAIQVLFNDITERMAAEDRLKESEERYRSIYNATQDAMIITSDTGRIVDANHTAHKMYGYDDLEMIGMNCTSLITEPYQNAFSEFVNDIKKQGIFRGNTIDIRKDGSTFHTEVFGSMITHKGKPYLLAVVRDITERKEFELLMLKKNEELARNNMKLKEVYSELQESEERNRSFLQQTSEAVIICDIDGKIIEWNKAAERIFSFSKDEILGRKVWDIQYNLSPSEIRKPELKKAMKNRILSHMLNQEGDMFSKPTESIIQLPDKSRKWIQSTAAIIRSGENTYLGSITQDITVRKLAERELKESEEKFRSFMETATDMMNIVDKDLKIIYANRAMIHNLEYSEKELMGMPVWKLLDDESRSNYYTEENHQKLIKEGKVSYEVMWKSKTGKIFTGELRITAIYDEEGNFMGSRGIFHDITERKRYEEELLKAKELAEESDRLKSSFLANMSHEIRTPLNGILGFSQMLREEDHSQKQKEEFIEYINRSGDQLLSIISDILNISTIEANQVTVHNEEFNLNSFLHDALNVFRIPKNLNHGAIELQSDFGLKNDDSNIISDYGKLQIIINNLVKNAFKFTTEGYIKLGYKVSGKKLQFYVADTGIGITKSKQKVIFERFRQADDSHTRKYGGTGLGLAISKGYIDKMNGEIWVDSKPNKGSTFFFTIPYRKA